MKRLLIIVNMVTILLLMVVLYDNCHTYEQLIECQLTVSEVTQDNEDQRKIIESLVTDIDKLQSQLEDIENTKSKETTEIVVNKEPTKKPSYDTFKLTAYCPCTDCSAGYGRATATGAVATAGRTIAVDPTVIPYGTKVIIDGKTYIAEDCGGAVKGNVIDIFFDTHEEVNAFGMKYSKIQIIGAS